MPQKLLEFLLALQGASTYALWHAAYGHPGTPIFRLPDFAGARSLEGHLEKFGLFVDKTRPFPGPGLIVLYSERESRRAFGLANEACSGDDGWSVDDTHDFLGRICERWSDREVSRSYDISTDTGRGNPV